jgi:hypothetical protein
MFNFRKIAMVPLVSGFLLVKGFFKPWPTKVPERTITQRTVEVITITGLLSALFTLCKGRFRRLPIKRKVLIIVGISLVLMMLLFGIIPSFLLLLKFFLKVITMFLSAILCVLTFIQRHLP